MGERLKAKHQMEILPSHEMCLLSTFSNAEEMLQILQTTSVGCYSRHYSDRELESETSNVLESRSVTYFSRRFSMRESQPNLLLSLLRPVSAKRKFYSRSLYQLV